jgi:aminoglycoside phosphotransferase family enzyme/predicted kinase
MSVETAPQALASRDGNRTVRGLTRFDVRDHIAELLDPACYPNGPDSVALAETHISCVFLAGDVVYKLKKPVDFGFVNYSTASRRQRFCRLEVKLNRRLTQHIYLGVAPLVRTPAGLRFDAPGKPVDWAVKMQRVPDAALWSSRLVAGKLGAPEMAQLGAFVADFHRHARRVRAHAAIEAGDQAWEDTVRDLDRFAEELFPRALLQEAQDAGRRWRRDLDPVLDRRLRAGRFVDGHGDLRLEHLCEVDGVLQALDCIEFSAALRRIDAASDLAFLLMDLDRSGRGDLALDLAAAYLRASGDAALPLCDRYYRAERALVRAKVDALAQANGIGPDHAIQRLRQRARRWVELATGYLQPRPRPSLVIVRGVSGTGKTTLATRLAAQLGFAWLATDYLRKQANGGALLARAGDASYTLPARRLAYSHLHRDATWYLERGFAVLLDATYLETEMQAAAASLAHRHGVPALALTLQAEPHVLRARLRNRALSASDADWEVAEGQIARSDSAPFVGLEEVRIDAGGTPNDVSHQALQSLTSWLGSLG